MSLAEQAGAVLERDERLTLPADRTRDLIERVASEHGVSVEEIMGVSRRREVVRARYRAMRLVRQARPHMSVVALAALFNRDPTTVLYALDRDHRFRKNKRDRARRLLLKVENTGGAGI